MKIKDYVFFAVIVIGIIFLFRWRMNILQEELSSAQRALNTNMDNKFRQLSDSVSAKSSVTVVPEPGMFDKLFNTAAEKYHKQIRELIPKVIENEIKDMKFENKYTTVNQAVIQLEGDSLIFRNDSGVVTKTVRVIPLTKDTSMLLILPQEIELTNVSIQPDPNNRDSVFVFLSARNKTTGQMLKITQATTYVLPGSKKKWAFSTQPYIGSDYDILNKEFIFKGGFHPISYNGKNMQARLLGIEFSYGLNNTPGVEIELIELQLKNKK